MELSFCQVTTTSNPNEDKILATHCKTVTLEGEDFCLGLPSDPSGFPPTSLRPLQTTDKPDQIVTIMKGPVACSVPKFEDDSAEAH